MRILGIDPGTIVVGYGIIDCEEDNISFVCCDALRCKQRSPLGERLSYIYDELCAVIDNYHPDAVAVEQPFVDKNIRSALLIGKAQAIAILAAGKHHLPCFEYSPMQIKQGVTSYGASSKEQVQQMVKLQLNLAEIPEPNDAADALAVAICHISSVHLSDIMNRQGDKK
ncbi:MAG: crossover junction endodeoxyribonuclease RuvC [Dehalococcoidales bacterium]|jgi:crossover junction endodeoxyribonuclease RuvC|nr:crossover junction endodeoxyribonuclease RuvC [Dehalococcoidales bacterium]MDD3994467.1 crossover junction endodeoxyribonuclease RuvC [Dehalococcoidales bacterium]NLT28794.1 crossover junction endodeoxyribonuclease RuvC [Dehalococcoidales bacterium]